MKMRPDTEARVPWPAPGRLVPDKHLCTMQTAISTVVCSANLRSKYSETAALLIKYTAMSARSLHKRTHLLPLPERRLG